MLKAYIHKASPPHKYKVMLYKGDKKIKTISFGASGYSDYPTHKDIARKEKYIQRHKSNENWKDPLTPGFWSRWLLWNKKSIKSSADDISKRFHMGVMLRRY